MNPDLMRQFGTALLKQSLSPYKAQPLDDDDIAVVGLDSEYWESVPGSNVLFSWQLGFEDGRGAIFHPPLTAERLLDGVIEHLKRVPKKLFFITFFVTAEAQFFYNNDWKVSEYKGKYSFSTKCGNTQIVVLDLAGWFPFLSLASAAEMFNLHKLSFPIVECMAQVARGDVSSAGLFANPQFREYAINDAVITGELWRRIRGIFLKRFGIDTLLTRTAPATSAAIFRKSYVTETWTQSWTRLRMRAVASAWGGRSECFFRGTCDEAFAFDAVGHHSSSAIAMGILPLAEDWHATTDVDEWLKAKGGLGRVGFEFPHSEFYPCLPVFSRGSLIFPLSGVSNCSAFEALLARECGAKLLLLSGFAYNSGTTSLAEYLSSMRALRAEAKSEAEREMLKLVLNGMVGKLFQKNLAPSLQVLKDYAAKHNLPLLTIMDMKGLDLPQSATVGSSFFPEWYALILGFARANISRILRDNKALLVSSDSVIVPTPELARGEDIEYKLQGKGAFVAYRSKFYRLGGKCAHHAVHNVSEGEKVLEGFLDQPCFNYTAFHIVKLRESVRHGGFGDKVDRSMSVSLGYDYKRKLLDNGWTMPWKDKEEREAFLDEIDERGKA